MKQGRIVTFIAHCSFIRVFAWRTAQPRVASSLLSTSFQRSLPALTALLASFGAPHIFSPPRRRRFIQASLVLVKLYKQESISLYSTMSTQKIKKSSGVSNAIDCNPVVSVFVEKSN
jgi:hypothetical protein